MSDVAPRSAATPRRAACCCAAEPAPRVQQNSLAPPSRRSLLRCWRWCVVCALICVLTIVSAPSAPPCVPVASRQVPLNYDPPPSFAAVAPLPLPHVRSRSADVPPMLCLSSVGYGKAEEADWLRARLRLVLLWCCLSVLLELLELALLRRCRGSWKPRTMRCSSSAASFRRRTCAREAALFCWSRGRGTRALRECCCAWRVAPAACCSHAGRGGAARL